MRISLQHLFVLIRQEIVFQMLIKLFEQILMREVNLILLKQFFADILDLIKFKILIFSLLTVIIAAMLAVDQYDDMFFVTLFYLLVGSTFVFSAAAALNHALEVNTDLLMPRTQNRPVAAKRFGFLSVIFGWICISIPVSICWT